MRLPGRLLVGLGLTILVLGLSVAVLVQPWFTQIVSARASEFAAAGVAPERGLELAQGVREYVAGTSTDVDQDLPTTVDGRPGFDEAARSHLADVANVISGARLLTGLVGGALTVWLLVEVIRRRTQAVADGLRMGAFMSAGFVVVAVVAGLTSFDWLFTAFHDVFFDPGTWTFPTDSLLIRLFPEPFWMTAAASWATLCCSGCPRCGSNGQEATPALRHTRRECMTSVDECVTLVRGARACGPARGQGGAIPLTGRDHRHTVEVTCSMAAKEGYCVKCKAKKDIVDPQDITMKNGRPATQGTCPDCGTKIFKIGSK